MVKDIWKTFKAVFRGSARYVTGNWLISATANNTDKVSSSDSIIHSMAACNFKARQFVTGTDDGKETTTEIRFEVSISASFKFQSNNESLVIVTKQYAGMLFQSSLDWTIFN